MFHISGERHVLITNYFGFYSNLNFALVSRLASENVFGILCETC